MKCLLQKRFIRQLNADTFCASQKSCRANTPSLCCLKFCLSNTPALCGLSSCLFDTWSLRALNSCRTDNPSLRGLKSCRADTPSVHTIKFSCLLSIDAKSLRDQKLLRVCKATQILQNVQESPLSQIGSSLEVLQLSCNQV